MNKNIQYFSSFLLLYCLFILNSCGTLNNGTFAENNLFSINEQNTDKLSDNRFNGVFQLDYNGIGKDNISLNIINNYKFNGTNIVERYYSIMSLDNDINISFSDKIEFEVYNKKYRYRNLLDDGSPFGEWENWLEYSFSDDCNILILHFEMSLEMIKEYPDIVPLFYLEFKKIK